MPVRIPLILTVVLLAALPLCGSYPAKDLALPVVGRLIVAGGPGFFTTLWVTNVSGAPAQVRLTFAPEGAAASATHDYDFALSPGEGRVFESLDAATLGRPTGIGALHIVASQPVAATARTFSARPDDPMSRSTTGATFNAIPLTSALGNGQSSYLHGMAFGEPGQQRNKMYVLETRGEPLSYSVTLLGPHGESVAERTFFTAPRMMGVIDLSAQFAGTVSHGSAVRVRGLNGGGRIVFAGAAVMNESHDASAFEMTFPTEERFRMPWGEVLAYVAVAFAIVAAALVYRR